MKFLGFGEHLRKHFFDAIQNNGLVIFSNNTAIVFKGLLGSCTRKLFLKMLRMLYWGSLKIVLFFEKCVFCVLFLNKKIFDNKKQFTKIKIIHTLIQLK